MNLSICIPTFNRCVYLKENIEIILSQINDIGCNDSIEICVSDNASTDGTEDLILLLQRKNPDNVIRYRRNQNNLGADWNFIHAMKMANGKYSILCGDDDFLKDGALRFILDLFAKYPDVSVFFSNRTCIDGEGHFVRDQVFLRKDVDFLLVDFKNVDLVRTYFALSRDIACLFSFISSLIYETKMVREAEFDESYIGTHYAFLFYWWNYLMIGNKLLYINKSYINCTVDVQQSFGSGLDRVLVDYRGYLFVAKKIFGNTALKLDFLSVLNYSHRYSELRSLIIHDKSRFMSELYPLLLECGSDKYELDEIMKYAMPITIAKDFVKLICPFIRR